MYGWVPFAVHSIVNLLLVVIQSLNCVLLCNPMNCSTPGFPVLHYLPELGQWLSQWYYPTIPSSITPFSCPQSFPALGSLSMSQFSAPGSQIIGASASASVPDLPMNTQDWFALGLTGLILQSKGLSSVFSSTTVQKHQLSSTKPSSWSSSHIHTWLLEKS